jgi:hypothetical protein
MLAQIPFGLGYRRTACIGPLERLGHDLIEIVNKGQYTLTSLLHRAETGPFEQAPHQDTEPDFHLIQPGTMLWGIHKPDAMTLIL